MGFRKNERDKQKDTPDRLVHDQLQAGIAAAQPFIDDGVDDPAYHRPDDE